ncbi:hypothetical protein KUTeg_023628 [Tegillarca granosa]|uniref:Hexosyltransferase n=1 Tax=Tegillarca granosa TaxID=220873 RepID=A0ABQ9E2A3_TEGGR|nr:hypothetical protein KUTeg_023628 [Tegillarca granosa]
MLANLTCQSRNNEQKSRKEFCNNCSWHGFKYIVKNDRICESGSQKSIKILFVILTQHSRKLQRAVIRRTWATKSKHNTGNIRYMFLLGVSSSEKENLDIIRESKLYGDILIEDFQDTYNNLTLKTIMAFKWASEKCRNAKYVMKIDDDMWINYPQLLKTISVYAKELKTTIGGKCFHNVKVDRNCFSKWYVSRKLYSGERYPCFCSGTAYITSLNLVRKIYEISKNVPYFYLEDVYVGLCVNKLGYNVTNIPGFYNQNATFSENLCDYKKPDIITVHKIPPSKIETLWNIKCDNKTTFIRDIEFDKQTVNIPQVMIDIGCGDVMVSYQVTIALVNKSESEFMLK